MRGGGVSYEQSRAMLEGWQLQMLWDPTTCEYVIRAVNRETTRIVQEPISEKATMGQLMTVVDRVCGIAWRDSDNRLRNPPSGE